MKKDYLVVNHFRLKEIIADENIGNTLCGYIPYGDGEYFYVNLFTESFEQLYFLLQSSKKITEPVLIEMAERMSSGEERPIIIEATNLNQSDFIEISLTFCLRNYETAEEWEKNSVKGYFIDKFFEFPDIKFLFEPWSENFEDEVFHLSLRYLLYKTLKAIGSNDTDSRIYSELDDDILFSICNKLSKELKTKRKVEAQKIDYSKLKIACADIEANQFSNKEGFSILLIVTSCEKQLSCNALRIDFYKQNVNFHKLEWLQRYFKFGNWYNCSPQVQNDVFNRLRQLSDDKLQPINTLLKNPIDKE
jgi:hypothetical protein